MALDLFSPGAYCRAPGGNLERPEIQAPVVRWMTWSINPDNSGGGAPEVWDKCRILWTAAGIEHFPWLHCRSMADIDRLIAVGNQYNSPAIGCNLEDVNSDFTSKGISLLDIAQKLSQWQKPIHMATLCWVQNGQGWVALQRCVAALEIFIDEVPACARTQDCIDHARAEGLLNVTLLLKTKPPNTPATYGQFYSICHSLYTADDILPTAEEWKKWEAPIPCAKFSVPDTPTPPTPPPMLSETQFPYTGPLYGPSATPPATRNRSSVKGLKRAMIRLRYLDATLGSETDDFGPALEQAMKVWEKEELGTRFDYYGRRAWNGLRAAKLTQGPNAGQWAMDALALKYVREDALKQCYPHPAGAPGTYVGQGLHVTSGITGNWAIDFMAPGGTAVLAVENAVITRLSGHDPASGADQGIGIFGWSISYETTTGIRYFSTHYGTRRVTLGQQVDCGQVIGTVGNWPGDPGRSHTHLGCSSPLGQTASKKRITEISQAPKIVL